MTKASGETFDYVFDFTSVLETGETISSFDVTLPSGITESQSRSPSPTKLIIWLTGGQNYTDYEITVYANTQNRRIHACLLLKIRNDCQ